MNQRSLLVGVVVALASLAAHAQFPPGGPGPQSPPLTQGPQVNLGRCYEIVVQNQGVDIALSAVAVNAYTVALTWSGLAGTYEINHTGNPTPFGASVTLGPPPTLKVEPTFKGQTNKGHMKPTQPAPSAPQMYAGSTTHTQAAPGAQHNYVIIATLADGRRGCGLATAYTPPAPEPPARTTPIDRPPPVQVVGWLTVVTANQSNAFALGGNIHWETKVDRFAEQIAASGERPDIISMTESSGWTNCSSPASDNSEHYDLVDRLIWRLRGSLGITYRVAYLVGQEGAFGPFGRCHYFSGDTVIYNPNRVTNLTPSDVAGQIQVVHDSLLLGFQVRWSLPICDRGARINLPDLDLLIDGPFTRDRCNRDTPSAPARAWQEQMADGSLGLTVTLARFGVVGVQGSSFDVFTVHPSSTGERQQHAAISRFIDGLTKAPSRTTRPYYPTIVLGDFNCLVGSPPYACGDESHPLVIPPWPAGTTQVFRSPDDVMAVALGNGSGASAPLRPLSVARGITLPASQPCRPSEQERIDTGVHFFPDRSFSDHCGLLVRFSE